MTRDQTATDSEPGAESPPSLEESGPGTSDSETSDSGTGDSGTGDSGTGDSGTGIEVSGTVGATVIHWLVRVAERAGLEGERPDIPPGTAAREAWPVVTRTYKIGDPRLCLLVATYFRLEVADFAMREPNAHLVVPEAMS